MIACGAMISLSKTNEEEEDDSQDGKVSPIVPVAYSVLAAVACTIYDLILAHLTDEKIGFDPTTLSFNSSSVAFIPILISGVSWYWQMAPFNRILFIIGFNQSIIDALANAA